jgi:hypothetical protein
MTDRQFEALIHKTADAQRKFSRLLSAAEEEYFRRYGSNPSEWDDDNWIDSLHGACGEAKAITIEQVEAGARMSGWRGSSAPLDANGGADRPDSARPVVSEGGGK